MSSLHAVNEGYLLVQNAEKKWKAHWFVLSEDHLSCQHKKKREITLRSVSLQGCSVVCPCSEPNGLNLQGLIKLHLQHGEEIHLHAGGPEDRDRWAHALGAVIRSLSTSGKISRGKTAFQSFKAQANVSEIIGAIQDPDAGIESASHIKDGVVFRNCFTGKMVVDWLLRWSLVKNRENGTAMGQTLFRLGHIQEVDVKDGSEDPNPRFTDSDKLFRFTSINLGAKRNSFYDSTDSDSSSSEDEEEDDDDDDSDKEESKVKKGKPVKEAFLEKKRNLRKGWKVKKVIVTESPPALLYYSAKFAVVTDEKFPIKNIDIESCKLKEIVKPPSVSKASSSAAAEGIKPAPSRYRIVLRSRKGKSLTFQFKDQYEKTEWMAVIHDIRKNHSSQDVAGSGLFVD